MGAMASGIKYPQELKDRALRLVGETLEAEPETARQDVIKRIAGRLGIPAGTLRTWFYHSGLGEGKVAKVAISEEMKKIKALEKENRELKRTNEILLAASSFFARELDPRLPF
jgi:transposase